jgi:Helix-turn-helix domain
MRLLSLRVHERRRNHQKPREYRTDMSTTAIILDKEEFAQIVRQAVREELSNQHPNEPDRLLTTEEAAAWLGVSPNSVRIRASRGTLKPVHIEGSRTVRYRLADLRDAVA